MAAEAINVVDWIAREENFPMPDSNFSYVSDFTLIWAYAELKLVKDYNRILAEKYTRGMPSLGCNVFNLILSDEHVTETIKWNSSLESAYSFFKKRYAGKEGKDRFNRLFPHDQDKKRYRDSTWQIISSETFKPVEQIKATAIICSRIRNNLFHGTKRLHHVVNQQGLIENAAIGIKGITIALLHR